MQLGVAHAMVVSQRQAPDLIVGISAGAVNAVTLAEVLQAGKGLSGECARDVQITRLRKILQEYRQAPSALLNAILPDGYEVNFSKALKPIRLPIHQQEERDRRTEAAQARSGVVHLFNGILRIRVSFSAVTRAARRILGLMQTAEVPDAWQRAKARLKLLWGLWWLAGKNLHNVTPQLQVMVWRIFTHRWLPKRSAATREGVEAHQLIFGRIRRQFFSRTGWIVGYILLAFAWVAVGVIMAFASLLWYLRMGNIVERLWSRRRSKQGSSWLYRAWNIILSTYSIDKALGDSHFLRRLFIRLFDPEYYGTAPMDDVVESALQHDYGSGYAPPSPKADAKPKQLKAYASGTPSVHVAPMAASVTTGELVALPETTPVVDALMAATAVVPLFRAVQLGQDTFIDGINISNEPTLALLDVLRERLAPSVGRVEIYPVTPFPISKEILPTQKATYTSLVEVVLRAMQLRRYRDATLERRIVGLYNDVMPPDQSVLKLGEQTFVNASVHPIELDEALELNERILRSSEEDQRRRMILEAVADGCRATLEAIMQSDIQATGQTVNGKPNAVSCRAVMGEANALPGTAIDEGPGVPEICKVCAAYRTANPASGLQMLRVKAERLTWPRWPSREDHGALASVLDSTVEVFENAPQRGSHSQRPMAHRSSGSAQTQSEGGTTLKPSLSGKVPWPEERSVNGQILPGYDRPIVTCLFSGGVFRGIYQIGVLNGLNELGLKPDIMAGSSVGSIMSALGAEVFFQQSPQERTVQIARLAATFLGLDRLILTDRFADFVRRLTLRGAETAFAPWDADIVFRRYDAPGGRRYERSLRRVVAGLERLLYVTPYELNELVKAGRLRHRDEVNTALRAYAQEFLERYDVGQELLGSEPLAMLITKHILAVHPNLNNVTSDSLPFDLFEGRGIRLLATTTNLRAGSLDVLGGSNPAFLFDGLLASSAFPGVFRPRFSWEVYRGASEETLFIDGGVMDNLPVAAVVGELAASANSIRPRPQIKGLGEVPHLIFAASLEVNVGQLSRQAVESTASNWPQLWKRARRLNYNRKIEVFARAQRDLRLLYTHYAANPDSVPRPTPLDIEILSVKPEWLCRTFAMHPMLGFRRKKQAASIAHGCASTLARFARVDSQWATGWGIKPELREQFDQSTVKRNEETGRIVLVPKSHGEGKCWFRDASCPFSKTHLQHLASPLKQTMIAELDQIYQLCGQPRTHQGEAACQPGNPF